MMKLTGLSGTTGRLSLRQNFSFSFLANAASAGCNWLLIVSIARLTTPETLGYYALAVAICMPAFEFARLSLIAIQSTDTRGRYDFCDYMGLRAISLIVLTAVILLIALQYSADPVKAVVIALVALRTIIWGVSDVFGGLFTQAERLDKSAASMATRALLGFLAAFLALSLSGSLEMALLAQTAVWIGVLICIDVRLGRQVLRNRHLELSSAGDRSAVVSPRWDLDRLRGLFVYAAPLALASGISILLENIPRYFIDAWLGVRELGIFAAVVSPVAIGGAFVSALNLAALPRLATLYIQKSMPGFFRVLRRILLLEIAMGLSGILVVAFFGREILILVFGPDYGDATELFQLVMVFILVRFVMTTLGVAINAMTLFRLQLMLQVLQISILVVLSFLLIKAYGVNGAVYALISARSFGILVSAVILYKNR